MSIRARFVGVLVSIGLIAGVVSTVVAESPARERVLTCSDGTTFTGMQVRNGLGRPPHTWRNVDQGGSPSAFVFLASFVTDPQGNVVESVSFDNSEGVARNQDLVTCSFTIPIGVFEGYRADFVGFFVP